MNSTSNSFYQFNKLNRLPSASEMSRPQSAYYIYSDSENEMERKINDEKREIRLLNDVGAKKYGYLQKVVNYKKLEGTYGRLKDSFSTNFVSVENMNYKKKKIDQALKKEIQKEEVIQKELKTTKNTLIDKTNELNGLQENYENQCDNHKKYEMNMQKMIRKARRQINRNNKIIDNYNNIIGDQRQEIITLLSNCNKFDNEVTDYLNLVEKNIKERDDLTEKLEEEKIHGKARKDMLEKEKNQIKNNIQILSDVNDKIKGDLNQTKENYANDKYNLENRNVNLEFENDDLNYEILDLNIVNEDLKGALEYEETHKKKKKPVKKKKNEPEEKVSWEEYAELYEKLKLLEENVSKLQDDKKELIKENKDLKEEKVDLNNELKSTEEELNILNGIGYFKKIGYAQRNKLFKDYQEITIEIAYRLLERKNPNPLSGAMTCFIFNKNDKISIIKTTLNDINNGVDFVNDPDEKAIKIYYHDVLNDDKIVVHFEYRISESNPKEKFYFTKNIYIPNDFAGIEGKITVYIPNDINVYGFQNSLFHEDNEESIEGFHKFKWNGVIPHLGFNEKIFYSLNEARWTIEYEKIFACNKELKHILMTIPSYFNGGSNEMESYTVSSNKGEFPKNDLIKIDKNHIYSTIKKGKKSLIKIGAQIKCDFHYKPDWSQFLDNEKLLFIEDEFKLKLIKINREILQNNKTNLPDYIKIGKWVENYLNFSPTFIETIPNPLKLISMKVGGFYDYAMLYMYLLRAHKIESTIIFGYRYEQFQRKPNFTKHCWVLSKINNNWMNLDPLYGLYTGNIPVTYVFSDAFNDAKIEYTPAKMAKYEELPEKWTIKKSAPLKKKRK